MHQLSRSNKRTVYLKHVDLYSEGIYRCEVCVSVVCCDCPRLTVCLVQVSAEAPSFNTAETEKEMKVYGEFHLHW